MSDICKMICETYLSTEKKDVLAFLHAITIRFLPPLPYTINDGSGYVRVVAHPG